MSRDLTVCMSQCRGWVRAARAGAASEEQLLDNHIFSETEGSCLSDWPLDLIFSF